MIVGLNGADHQEALMRGIFTSVTRHDFTAPPFPPPEAVAAYVRSLGEVQLLSDPLPLVSRVLADLFPNGQDCLPIISHTGILICA